MEFFTNYEATRLSSLLDYGVSGSLINKKAFSLLKSPSDHALLLASLSFKAPNQKVRIPILNTKLGAEMANKAIHFSSNTRVLRLLF